MVAFLSINLTAQVLDYTVEAIDSLIADSILKINGEIFGNWTGTPVNGEGLLMVGGEWTNYTLPSGGHDSIDFNVRGSGYFVEYLGGVVVDSALMDGRYITMDSLAEVVITDKAVLDSMVIGFDTLITFSGGLFFDRSRVITYPYLVAMLDTTTVVKNTWSITLPYASTVAGRIALAVEVTDYPEGWVLAADGLNLEITHSLGKWATSIDVSAKTSGTIRQDLQNTARYSYWEALSDDELKIYSLATIPKEIVIYISVE